MALYPALFAGLRADGSLMGPAMEEVLRWDQVAQALKASAAPEPIELVVHVIHAGDPLTALVPDWLPPFMHCRSHAGIPSGQVLGLVLSGQFSRLQFSRSYSGLQAPLPWLGVGNDPGSPEASPDPLPGDSP